MRKKKNNLMEISFACGSIGEIPVLQELIKDAMEQVEVDAIFKYAEPFGMLELREEVAKLVNASDFDIGVDNVMITSSSQQGLDIVLDQVVDGKKVYLQEPAYFGVIRLLKKKSVEGADVVSFADVFELDDVVSGSVVYLNSNFHNPTGNSLTTEDKERVVKLAEEKDLMIIEDNPQDQLYYFQKSDTIFSMAPENTIYVSSFSKILAPGLRIGYLIANSELIKGIRSEKINRDLFTSTLNQQVCLYALRNSKYLNELRNEFKNRRDYALEYLAKFFGNLNVTWNKPKGGIFVLVDFNKPTYELIKVAQEEHNLKLCGDSQDYFDSKSRNRMRLNMVCNDREMLQEGMLRLYSAYMGVGK